MLNKGNQMKVGDIVREPDKSPLWVEPETSLKGTQLVLGEGKDWMGREIFILSKKCEPVKGELTYLRESVPSEYFHGMRTKYKVIANGHNIPHQTVEKQFSNGYTTEGRYDEILNKTNTEKEPKEIEETP